MFVTLGLETRRLPASHTAEDTRSRDKVPKSNADALLRPGETGGAFDPHKFFMSDKKPLMSLTAKDFRWDYFNGEGKGGQNRNKVAVCVRCFHDPSKSMGVAQDERQLLQNKKLAFQRCVATESFQKWLKLESMKKAGLLANIEEEVEKELKKVKVEVKDENGRWVDEKFASYGEDMSVVSEGGVLTQETIEEAVAKSIKQGLWYKGK